MKNALLAVACGLLLTAGISQAQVVVHVGPPARPHEVIPPPPAEHRDWAWHGGYHRWDGHRYVWVPGSYERPPHPHAIWVDGHWDHKGEGYVYSEGHWR